ncbi:MurR/RpiR family transcriptional regulator [Firmicutes bacterium OM07-11]|nr:MurR/RpiR family transcriptional regulator [Firmicutes bacterium OM07-11]
MNVLQNLTELYNHLSFDSTYRNVCKGILENMEEAANGTIYEIAELTNSSRTTIWRMVQKMGYSNFSEFHHELKRAVKQYTYYNRILPKNEGETPQEIKEKFMSQVMQTYQLMDTEMNMDEMESIVDEMAEADKIVFYTPYKDSSILALQQNLSMDGKQTGYYCLFPDMLEDSLTLDEHSIVFTNMIDHLETMDMTQVFENIKRQKARVYGSMAGKSRYQIYFDQILFSSKEGNVVEGVLTFQMYFFMLNEIYRMKYID